MAELSRSHNLDFLANKGPEKEDGLETALQSDVDSDRASHQRRLSAKRLTEIIADQEGDDGFVILKK